MIASLLRRLTKAFAPEVVATSAPTRPVEIWDMTKHQEWGNRIGWFDVKKLKLSGHTTPHPEPGDILLCWLKNNRVGQFRFVNVEIMNNVDDMWFADMEKI